MSFNNHFIVEGGTKLSGEITPSGNKNEALPVIAASLLTKDEVIIENIPDIIDTGIMIDIARDLGVKAVRSSKGKYSFKADEIVIDQINV